LRERSAKIYGKYRDPSGMPQIFKRSTNTLSRLSIFGALVVVAGVLWGLAAVNRSAYVNGVGVARAQPVQFSHKHHAGELGIDCRYCGTGDCSRRSEPSKRSSTTTSST
jgi:hypothetical protein